MQTKRLRILPYLLCMAIPAAAQYLPPGGGGGGASTPGGATTAIQFNTAGSVDGNATNFQAILSLPTPVAPTVAAHGTTGATEWAYKVAYYLPSGQGDWGPVTTIANGNETLDATNYNIVTPPACPSIENVRVLVAVTTVFDSIIGVADCGAALNDQGQRLPGAAGGSGDYSTGVFIGGDGPNAGFTTVIGAPFVPPGVSTEQYTANLIVNMDNKFYSNGVLFLSGSDSSNPILQVVASRGDMSDPQPVQNGDFLGCLSFAGWMGSGFSNGFSGPCAMAIWVDGVVSTNPPTEFVTTTQNSSGGQSFPIQGRANGDVDLAATARNGVGKVHIDGTTGALSVAAGTIGKAFCKTAAGTLGSCSSVVGADGSCDCN